jgi:hypothetical protein
MHIESGPTVLDLKKPEPDPGRQNEKSRTREEQIKKFRTNYRQQQIYLYSRSWSKNVNTVLQQAVGFNQ